MNDHIKKILDILTYKENHMKTKTYNYYSDPSHGWLKVLRSEVENLQIMNKISTCSYMNGEHIYLEEDCDASLFINAQKEKGIDIKLKEFSTNRSSKIRSYMFFKNVCQHKSEPIPFAAYTICKKCGEMLSEQR